MGTAGRKPKPIPLRILEGNREHKPIPDIPKIAPTAQDNSPRWFNDLGDKEVSRLANKKWKEIVSKLKKYGLAKEIDEPLLEILCVTLAKYRVLTRKTKIEATRYESGLIRVNPLMNVELQYIRQLVDLLSRFGMSPSDRNKVLFEPVGLEFEDDEDLD